MKILHTGDWHIGKLVHGIHMTEDQRHLLQQLVQLIREEKPQVLLIAGDVYDRSVPPIEAVDLLDQVLSEIVSEHQVKVIVIAGNHDSPDRLAFGSQLLRDQGLFISGNLEKTIEPILIEDEEGTVAFYPIPYAEPALVRALYEDEGIRNHETAMEAVMKGVKATMDPSRRSVCIAHAFVMGTETLETSESERPLSVGGSEYVSVEHFEGFSYVAIGHLHGPQKVKHDHIRYSGSLMKYSFSEARQHKSVTLVTIGADGSAQIELKILEPLRDMRVIKGTMENLLNPAVYAGTNTEDYIMAIVTDRGELVDTMSKLRAVYPNILRMERETFDREAGEDRTSAGSAFTQKNPLELFAEFYENVSRETFTEDKKTVISDLINEISEKGRNS